MSRGAKILIYVANIAVFVGLIFWVRNYISFDAVLAHLVSIPRGTLLTALMLNVALLAIYGVRLAALLEIRFAPALATSLLGFGLNGLLPLRLGELAKVAYAHRIFAIPPASLAAATAMEKLLDLGALALIGLCAAQTPNFSSVRSGVLSLVAIFAIGVAGFAGVFWALHRWRDAMPARFAWLSEAATLTSRKLQVRIVLALVAYTVLIWIATIAVIHFLFASIFAGFGVTDALILTLILTLAIALPSAPAGIGVVEAGVVAYLHQMLNADVNQALAAALAFHVVTVLPQVVAAIAIIGWNADTSVRLRARVLGRNDGERTSR